MCSSIDIRRGSPENVGFAGACHPGETDKLNVRYDIRNAPPPPHGDARRRYLMELAMNNIRRSSHTRKSKKIVMEWVITNYPAEIGDEFALGIPMSVLELILAGVALFAV
jgi:hypothetical protein